MNSGSLLASTCEKSIDPAVKPADEDTYAGLPLHRRHHGVTQAVDPGSVVGAACGAEAG